MARKLICTQCAEPTPLKRLGGKWRLLERPQKVKMFLTCPRCKLLHKVRGGKIYYAKSDGEAA